MEFVIIPLVGFEAFDYFFSIFFWLTLLCVPILLVFVLFTRKW
ncbi:MULTISPECIES: hypothetical protein [unclassified Campylobacter]|nr:MULTISPECIES: hypothetical protein [unclassified Campylobacter]MDA3056769.1 hypothetical protein [Campylobacter sp. CN_NA1]MDA3065942.1 hypothetical protein [Campylobacter sp. CN_NE4]MDA3069102.1 hypothetical protein [Campylobacter sp. CN_NE3]MDA3083268.1 hypothetical protein [Campylobacter sp. CN_EL2]MDA3084795.1 hypothetical protein [Campylobacter sp. CN_NE1]